MSRGMQVAFDMLVIAAIVGVVLAILMLIFVDNARSFQESIDRNRCVGVECGFASEARVGGVFVSYPSSVYAGERAVFRIIDEDRRFDRVRVEVSGDERVTGGVVSPLSARLIDPGPTVHTTSYDDTDEPGSYPYTIIGTTHEGDDVVIERGVLRVLESQGVVRARAVVDTPDRFPSPGRLTIRVEADPRYESGRLIFASSDRVVRVDLMWTGEGVLAGQSYEGLDEGIYVLDPDASRLIADAEHPLDASLTSVIRVTPPLACASSSECNDAMPYCTDGYCSPVCAAFGERASDAQACCADHVLEDGVCRLPGAPLRIVLVPVGVDADRVDALASSLEETLRSSSPLDACGASRLSVEVASCSCSLEGDVSREEYDACLDAILACGLSVRPDLDIVGGIVGPQVSIDGEALFARAERGGQRFVMSDPSENPGGELARQLGHVFGLGQLACGYEGVACVGPNYADCGPLCDAPGAPGCGEDSDFSSEFVMASCERLGFGPAAYELLARMDVFVRATEVCR